MSDNVESLSDEQRSRTQVKKSFLGPRSQSEVPLRCPITQEFMVGTIVAGRRGEKSTHPASRFFPDVLIESIERMVTGICIQYASLAGETREDLSQRCLERIWTKLEKFDENKGKFTTWSGHVCLGVIFKICRRTERRRSVMVSSDRMVESKGSVSPHETEVMRSEIAEAVRELIGKYPAKKAVIIEMFGNPDESDFVPDPDICFARIARAAGTSSNDVASFFKKKAQPFFKRRLTKCSGTSHREAARARVTISY